MKKIYFIILAFFIYPITLIGQNSATASFTASVTIIDPIEIRNTANMNFASIDARKGGSVTLHTDNTRTVTGDIILENASSVSAAEFEVKGQNGYTYDITIPEGNYIMISGTKEILLSNFKISSDSNTLNTDSQIFKIGATIEVEGNQKPGRYITPTPLEVTVSYN
ncbi:MAG TPA: DUF4402 domain-containing protein [Christiangramia sp.]|nr:DUF4402 domain-containing protein [Christiangramia sp.]